MKIKRGKTREHCRGFYVWFGFYVFYARDTTVVMVFISAAVRVCFRAPEDAYQGTFSLSLGAAGCRLPCRYVPIFLVPTFNSRYRLYLICRGEFGIR